MNKKEFMKNLREDKNHIRERKHFTMALIYGVSLSILGNFFVNIIWHDILNDLSPSFQLTIKSLAIIFLIVLVLLISMEFRKIIRFENFLNEFVYSIKIEKKRK